MEYDLIKFLKRQKAFSQRTFGPGDRTKGIIAHIRKELEEIEESPKSLVLEEIIDVVILALDMSWRLGYDPEEVVGVLEHKYRKNMTRKWPDWRTAPSDEPIEHDRTQE